MAGFVAQRLIQPDAHFMDQWSGDGNGDADTLIDLFDNRQDLIDSVTFFTTELIYDNLDGLLDITLILSQRQTLTQAEARNVGEPGLWL